MLHSRAPTRLCFLFSFEEDEAFKSAIQKAKQPSCIILT